MNTIRKKLFRNSLKQKPKSENEFDKTFKFYNNWKETQSTFNNDLYEKYLYLLEAAKADKNLEPLLDNLPVLALIGLQSHGKSSLVNALLPVPIAPTKTGQGTRCPVLFKVVRTMDPCEERAVFLNGVLTEPELVRKKVAETVSTELEVLIKSVSARTLCILDLPGLAPGSVNDETAEENLRLVKSYLARHDVKPIFVIKAEDFASSMAPLYLSQVFSETGKQLWTENARVVVTHFDEIVRKVHSFAEADAFFAASPIPLEKVSFVSLLPSLKLFGINESFSKDKEEVLMLQKWFEQLKQQQIIEETSCGSNRSSHLDKSSNLENAELCDKENRSSFSGASFVTEHFFDHWEHLGMRHAILSIEKLWLASFKVALTPLSNKLEANKKEIGLKIAVLKESQASLANSVSSVFSQLENETLQEIRFLFQYRSEVHEIFKVSTFGRSLENDFCASGLGDVYTKLVELVKNSENVEQRSYLLESCLLGSSQIVRAIDALRLLLYGSTETPLALDEVLATAGEAMDSAKAVKECTQARLSELFGVLIERLAALLREILGNICRVVLTEKLRSIFFAEPVLSLLKESFVANVCKHSEALISEASHLLQVYANNLAKLVLSPNFLNIEWKNTNRRLSIKSEKISEMVKLVNEESKIRLNICRKFFAETLKDFVRAELIEKVEKFDVSTVWDIELETLGKKEVEKLKNKNKKELLKLEGLLESIEMSIMRIKDCVSKVSLT